MPSRGGVVVSVTAGVIAKATGLLSNDVLNGHMGATGCQVGTPKVTSYRLSLVRPDTNFRSKWYL